MLYVQSKLGSDDDEPPSNLPRRRYVEGSPPGVCQLAAVVTAVLRGAQIVP